MNALSSSSSSFVVSSSPASFHGPSAFTARELQVLDALRPFLGAEAEGLYAAQGRSLHKLVCFARESSLPGCAQLLCGLRLARELLAEELRPGEAFRSLYAVSDYLKLHFAGQAHESFAVLFLDARHTLLAFEDLFRGTLTQTGVYPREVLKRALQHNASAVILAHNHPSGVVEPSPDDLAVTEALKSALALIDVRVLDHIVVGADRVASMAERGLL
ncbi:DNA repair protein RadC [Variovorax sp. NFACC27]|uniref:RadC family protein n=1 Tax=unclassified Variovorax TaxID=663243 RepID=UPI000898CCE3|nr:RadC-like JAB domain-containing protein [Variovorax sp. NFACC28]SEG99332.1 RadC-like JAB domain-containing protein [Variovorax sp. NFACC29]SFE21603.1 RadC-like JAB domain-containing protein [Variovorax sp. NFACC26]SFH26735.1 RadC-like JAB domain-containing protein [Variovorax sp. NFACC27]